MKFVKLSLLFLLLTTTFITVSIGKNNNKETSSGKASETANTQSLWIVNALPRYGGDSELDQKDVEDLRDGKLSDNKWLQGIIGYAAICLLIPVISLVICPIFFILRCCKCCCCKKKEPKNYLQLSKLKFYWIPFIFILMCCIVMVVFSGLAYVANSEFSDVLLYRGHGDPKVKAKDSNLWDIIITVMSEGGDKLDDTAEDTNDLKPVIINAINEVQVILADTSVLENGTDVLIDMLHEIEVNYANKTLGEPYTSPWTSITRNIEFECEFCKTIATEVGLIRVEIEDQTEDIFADLNKTVTSVNEDLVSQNKSILSSVDDFVVILDDTKDQLIDLQDEFSDNRDDVEDYNDQREIIYNAFFAIPLVPIVIVVLGGFFKLSACFTLGYILLWMTCVIMFGLLSIHLPIAAFLSDMCDYLDMVDDDVTKYYDNDIGKTVQACLDNSLLSEALGLDDKLNFTNSITFPDLGNVSDSFNFEQLDSFSNDTQNTTFETFYGAGDEALVSINQMIANCTTSADIQDNQGNQLFLYTPCLNNFEDRYDRTNVSLCDPALYYDSTDTTFGGDQLYIALSNLTDVLGAEALLITDFNNTILNLQSNLTAVNEQSELIENDTVALSDSVNNASSLLNPVFKQVDKIIDTARCGFIGEGYVDKYHIICEDVMGVIARIVVAMIVVGVVSIVACCISFKMVRRTHWLKNLPKAIEKDKILKQNHQPGAKKAAYNSDNYI